MSNWIKELVSPETRKWEDFYRNRFQHDKVVRSTHGVNCTGSCSWNVYVKSGIVTWELQALDYPKIGKDVPPYEPRGCQRGISFSWYLYSPIRIKYPYVRGAFIDIWREAKTKHADPVEAFDYIQSQPELRERYQRARGKGGFRRISWDEILEIICASNIRTAKKYGPDRVVGFSPIPAMSMISYAAGARFLQLFGGVALSFYDWYCDLPPASPEMWGEQTDVAESADWFHSKFIAIMGANLNMTRTPDVHFIPEARANGTKVTVFSPDFSQVSKFADEWVPVHQGQDGAFWMAVNHVLLTECYHEREIPYFLDYQKRFTDNPFLVELEINEDGVVRPGQFVRAGDLDNYNEEENGEWKFLVWDKNDNRPKMPMGSMGHRWQGQKGQWNLLLQDGRDGSEIDPVLTFIDDHDEQTQIEIHEYGNDVRFMRGVPSKTIKTKNGKKIVTTVFDLLMAQHGVNRGLDGEYPTSYDDEKHSYTPAWQEKFSGIGRDTVLKFAREWANTAEKTNGKCSVIIGAGIDHWYHNNLMYRSCMTSLVLCGCIGKNGGGLNHYVGQEKLAPQAPWGSIAFAKDWQTAARLQNAPSWHYMHSDQWRYDTRNKDYNVNPGRHPMAGEHVADINVKAVKNGWMPFYPQYKENTLEVCKEAKKLGITSAEDLKAHVLELVKTNKLTHAIEDIDAEESFPRIWYIWRGNAIGTSSKGHEFFLNHYLGTHTNIDAHEAGKEFVEESNGMKKLLPGKWIWLSILILEWTLPLFIRISYYLQHPGMKKQI